MKHCCDRMRLDSEQNCEVHSEPADCPDRLIAFEDSGAPKGLWVHDGGSSFVDIQYCPWCGKSVERLDEEVNIKADDSIGSSTGL